MLRLPPKASQSLNHDPNIKYDARIRMQPSRATSIFHHLSLQRTKYVSISVKKNGGVWQVSFIKDRGDPNVILDRGGDGASTDEGVNQYHEDANLTYEEAYRYQISCSNNAYSFLVKRHEETTVVYMRREVSLCLCMTCLHTQINQMNINYPDATEVEIYLGPAQNNFVLCRVPRQASNIYLGFRVPLAKHMYHSKRCMQRVRLDSFFWEFRFQKRMEALVAAAADDAAFVAGHINDREEEGQDGGRR